MAVSGNTVWAGGRDGVVGIDRHTGAIVETPVFEPPIRDVKSLAVAVDGSLVIAHDQGVTTFTKDGSSRVNSADGLPSDRIFEVMFDRNGKLWVGTDKGAAVRDGTTWHVLTKKDGLADDHVNRIYQDSRGAMWFGSYSAPRGGVTILDKGKFQVFDVSSGLPHNDVTCIQELKDGTVWVGTGFVDKGGAAAFKYSGDGYRLVQSRTKKDGLAGEKVRSILQERAGALWFGSEYDGIAVFSDSGWRILTENDGLSNPEVKCMVQDTDGSLWLGTRDGVTRIDAMAVRKLSEPSLSKP